MPFAIGGAARIRTNIPAENAYNALERSSYDISNRQLRLSTGKRINNASDDVAGYITSRALIARNGTLKSAVNAVGDANNVLNILMDALDNINALVTTIKNSTATASSGALGKDEKVVLAKAAFRMTEQIQTVVDSTVFGAHQLLDGVFSADFMIGTNALHDLLTINIDVSTTNADFDIDSGSFEVNALNIANFAGVTGLDLRELAQVKNDDLGLFKSSDIHMTLKSLSDASRNINKVAAYIGGISNRLTSQEDLLNSQIVNYNAAISRIEDTDVAKEQLALIKSQFLQQTSLTSLAQANQNPNAFLRLLQGG